MQLDKIIHFLLGFSLAAILLPAFGGKIAFLSVLAVAVLKEVYDRVHNAYMLYLGKGIQHTPDAEDLLITCLGGVLAIAMSEALCQIT